MKTQLTLLTAAIAISCGSYSTTALSARSLLPANAVLTITAGVPIYDASGNQTNVTSGSYFGMDLSGNSKIGGVEKTALSQGQFGIRIGVATNPGASHNGAILPGDTNEVDAPWLFSSSTGSGQFTSGPTEISVGIIDWTNFVVNWNANVINMGGGLVWQPQNCTKLGCTGITFTTGHAAFQWDGTWGDPYILQYAAVVPTGSFTGTQYYLHFEGIVNGPPNSPPVASGFGFPMLNATTVSLNVAANASDSDGNLDPSSVVITNDGSAAAGCAAGIQNNGDGTVTLPSCPSGSYTFNYTIKDTYAYPLPAVSNVATVTVTVSATPPPNTTPDTATTNGVAPVIIDVLTNDSGGGTADPATVAITTPASHGVTAINKTNGAITYTANASFAGVEQFNYTVGDGSGNISAPTLVSVTVSAVNNPASNATLTPGATAVAAGSTNGVVTFSDIGFADDAGSTTKSVLNSCIGGCFDFVLNNVTGTEAKVVLPLSTPIPALLSASDTLSYRKLNGSGWHNFDTSGKNIINTAPGKVSGPNLTCPTAADPVYDSSTGLTKGNRCVRLTIVDNGPNDDNPTLGIIADPGGIAEIGIVDNRVAGTSGCSMTGNPSSAKDHADWLLVAGFIAMLGFLRLKRKA